jgi:hypothetical protein
MQSVWRSWYPACYSNPRFLLCAEPVYVAHPFMGEACSGFPQRQFDVLQAPHDPFQELERYMRQNTLVRRDDADSERVDIRVIEEAPHNFAADQFIEEAPFPPKYARKIRKEPPTRVKT